jgi:hypothetical protein
VHLRDGTGDDLPALYERQIDEPSWRMAAFTPRDHDAFFARGTCILAEARRHPRGRRLDRARADELRMVLRGRT